MSHVQLAKPTAFTSPAAAVFCSYLCLFAGAVSASECANLTIPGGQVLWCDSFEDSDLPSSGNPADNYFDWDGDQGDQARVSTEAMDGSYSLRQRFQAGEISAGHLFRTFGRSPVSSQSHSTTDFQEIYWRIFVKYPAGTASFPDKLSRATVFAAPNWAQAMIGHVWLSTGGSQFLALDPASGTTPGGALATTGWNDFANLRWLGLRSASTPVAAGQWQCVEMHIALNSAGNSDGVFELWIDGQLEAAHNSLNWVGSYNAYGINAVMLSAYWNAGASSALDRFLDGFVIATARVGCSAQVRPNPPTGLTSN